MYSCTQKCISVFISVQSVQDARYQVHISVQQIQRKCTDNLARLRIPSWLSTSLPAEVHTQRQCSITLSKSNAQSRGISEQCTCVLTIFFCTVQLTQSQCQNPMLSQEESVYLRTQVRCAHNYLLQWFATIPL